ncbi:MAG: FecR domain-containing protein, partial [Bacteroidota bacterium]
LEEGKIQLKMDELTQAMIPGEVVNFSKKTQAIVSKNTLTAEKRGNWRNGILTLKEEKVANILQEIEMIYGLEVELKNEVLANETRTMAFPINQLELTISILEKTLATTITHQGNRLIVE